MGRLRDPRTLARYLTVAAIVLTVGAIFVQREIRSDGDATSDSALGTVLDDHRPEVGRPAPDFVVRALDGDPVRLSDFRGRTVVLNFWATWCAPCRLEMPDFQAAWEARGDGGAGDLVVLAVDFKEREAAVASFVEEFGLTFPVGLDERGEIADHYGLLGLPATFFIDRDGVIRHSSLGPVTGDLLPDGIAIADAAGAPAG